MIFGNYNSITFQDIERLVSNKIPESRTLDYKRDLNIEKGDDRKDFLYDISSFANTDGGTIIFGISECKDSSGQNTGIPDDIFGVNLENSDKQIQKIEDLIKAYIEPNIPNITIRSLENNGKKVLIIGIPKPFGLPRMVTYNDSNKFHKRRNTGKYLLDVYELNQLFMNTYELIKQVEEFRRERVKEILSANFINNIDNYDITLIHITPVSFYPFNQLSLLDDSFLNEIRLKLGPIGVQGWDCRHNFEGFLLFRNDITNDKTEAFTQVFRNGIIEFFTHAFHRMNSMQKKTYYLGWLELEVIDRITKAIEIYKKSNVQPPLIVQLTILGLKDRIVDIKNYYRISYTPFMTDNLYVPNLLINDYEINIPNTLKSTFDIVWQSAGIRESPFYDSKGERIKK